MQDLTTHPPPQVQSDGQVFVAIPIEKFNTLMDYVQRIVIAVEHPTPGPREATVEVDNYGINPVALFNDQDLQQMIGVCEKTTYRWRKEGFIEYQIGAVGGSGSRIWYTGQQIIDFYRRYAVSKKLKRLNPNEKVIPKGHV